MAGGTVIKSVGFGVFQNLIQIWSRMGTIWVSFCGVVYMRVFGAYFTLEALHNLIVAYLKNLLNGVHIPYHSIQ